MTCQRLSVSSGKPWLTDGSLFGERRLLRNIRVA